MATKKITPANPDTKTDTKADEKATKRTSNRKTAAFSRGRKTGAFRYGG